MPTSAALTTESASCRATACLATAASKTATAVRAILPATEALAAAISARATGATTGIEAGAEVFTHSGWSGSMPTA